MTIVCSDGNRESPPPSPPSAPLLSTAYDFAKPPTAGWSTTSTPNGSASGGHTIEWTRASGNLNGGTGPLCSPPGNVAGSICGGHGIGTQWYDGGFSYGGSDFYYYADTSPPATAGDVYIMSYDGSACATLGGISRISFDYSMVGSNIGRLTVKNPDTAATAAPAPAALPAVTTTFGFDTATTAGWTTPTPSGTTRPWTRRSGRTPSGSTGPYIAPGGSPY